MIEKTAEAEKRALEGRRAARAWLGTAFTLEDKHAASAIERLRTASCEHKPEGAWGLCPECTAEALNMFVKVDAVAALGAAKAISIEIAEVVGDLREAARGMSPLDEARLYQLAVGLYQLHELAGSLKFGGFEAGQFDAGAFRAWLDERTAAARALLEGLDAGAADQGAA